MSDRNRAGLVRPLTEWLILALGFALLLLYSVNKFEGAKATSPLRQGWDPAIAADARSVVVPSETAKRNGPAGQPRRVGKFRNPDEPEVGSFAEVRGVVTMRENLSDGRMAVELDTGLYTIGTTLSRKQTAKWETVFQTGSTVSCVGTIRRRYGELVLVSAPGIAPEAVGE